MSELELCNYWIYCYKRSLADFRNAYYMFRTEHYKSQLKYWQTRKLKTVLEKQ